MRKIFGGLVLVIIFTLCSPRIAKPDEFSELKLELQKIQREKKALEEQMNEQRKITERLLGNIEALESKDEALSKEVKRLQERPEGPILEKEAELSGIIDIPKLKINGFSDIGFGAEITDDENSNTFTLGAVDLFITSEIADKLSFLSEMEFHFNTDTNASDFHIERVNLKYSFSDLFNVKIGRMHTALGYWNQTYHHGTWLQTSIFRPEIYLWEDDDGGFLPVHTVGVEAFGVKEWDAIDFEGDWVEKKVIVAEGGIGRIDTFSIC